jgi:hypothetical protein
MTGENVPPNETDDVKPWLLIISDEYNDHTNHPITCWFHDNYSPN